VNNSNHVLSLLGLARRAGNIITGQTLCIEGVKSKKVSLLIIAGDLNETTRYKMSQLCETEGVEYRIFSNKADLSHAVGKENYGLFGVTNKKFSRAIIDKMEAL
jgi:ribosomal protein L7Ae-like RNA K-turn-binding protein